MRWFPILLCLLVPANAVTIQLEEAWFPKLNQLCEAARYGNRMLADKLCEELSEMAKKAAVEEEKAKAEAEKEKDKK
jgi:hypothetical protein